MIPVPIAEVDVEALNALIENTVRESKTIEYKEQLPGKKDSDVGRLLATVASLANTDGGDLILGVKEDRGLPVELPGMEIEDVDQEKLRLNHMLLNGVEPRLPPVDIHEVETAKDRYVMVIRVPTSWAGPHRVRQSSKFYGRTSAGRYELDVGEVRAAFAMSETVPERIRGFRTDRIGRIERRETPAPLVEGACMAVHVIPLSAFRTTTAIGIAELNERHNWMRGRDNPGAWHANINLDGIVTYPTNPATHPLRERAYTQMFRNGAAEALWVLEKDEGQTILPAAGFEERTAEFVDHYLEVAARLGTEPPYYAFLTFLAGRDLVLRRFGQGRPVATLQRGTLTGTRIVLPEVVIEEADGDAFKALKPTFDLVWNAFGIVGSRNYDKHGNWSER